VASPKASEVLSNNQSLTKLEKRKSPVRNFTLLED